VQERSRRKKETETDLHEEENTCMHPDAKKTLKYTCFGSTLPLRGRKNTGLPGEIVLKELLDDEELCEK
jgi:hypothetical protein